MKRMRFLLVASVLLPVLAFAQPKTADEWYKEGETQYNLGNFDKAADAFKQGFAIEPNDSKKPAYLYNVAQAYRQGKKCKDAAFFYKRYLSLKEQDTAKPLKADKRAEIEQRINELEECAKTQDTIARKPPDDTLHPDHDGSGVTKGSASHVGTTTTTNTTGTGTGSGKRVAEGESSETGSDEDNGGGVTQTVSAPPKLLSARFTGGASKIKAGSLSIPVQATFSLMAGYPIAINDKIELDLGPDLTFTPVPFTNTVTGVKKTGSFISALADAGGTYTVAPKIGVRADVGVGVLVFSGISDMGNPFTNMGASTSGALTMFAVRAAISGDYAITPNIIATITPLAFTYSPAKTGLRSDIKSITGLDFMLGIGYRM